MASQTSMMGIPDRSFTVQPRPVDTLDLAGRRLVVIGGTDGLGRAISQLAASRGALVTVVGRTFRDQGMSGLSFVKADLSSMAEAQRLGRELPVEQTDAVLLTAGTMAAKQREVTPEGVERDMAISSLSRFAVLEGLAPRLGTGRPASAPAPRVFVMGFPGSGQVGDPTDLNADRSYGATAAHMNTVALNEALVLAGAKRDPRLRYFGLNPGLVKTGIRANLLGDGSLAHRAVELLIGLAMPSPQRYAARIVPLLVAPELEQRSGVMFGAKATPILPSPGLTPATVEAFMTASAALVARATAGSRG